MIPRFLRRAKSVNVRFHDLLSREVIAAEGKVGESLMDVARRNDLRLEGVCGGRQRCGTCHLLVTNEVNKTFPEPCEAELDLLDNISDENSRLGCCLRLTDAHSETGIDVEIPKTIINQFF